MIDEAKQNEQKSQEISNAHNADRIDQANYLCNEDTRLLLRILKKIIDHPNADKFKNIHMTRLTKKIFNYYLCVDILKQAGFTTSNDGLRLVFDEQQYDQLQAVYLDLLAMKIFDSNEYISNSYARNVILYI